MFSVLTALPRFFFFSFFFFFFFFFVLLLLSDSYCFPLSPTQKSLHAASMQMESPDAIYAGSCLIYGRPLDERLGQFASGKGAISVTLKSAGPFAVSLARSLTLARNAREVVTRGTT